MLEISDTFVEPAVYKRYDKKIGAFLQYRLVITPDPFNKNKNGEIFSIVIIKLKTETESESEFIFDIARNREKAFEILSGLCENDVTPILAKEVVEDLI